MKFFNFLILPLIVLFSCSKGTVVNKSELHKIQSDSLFVVAIKDKNLKKTIFKIDSLIEFGEFSKQKKGLLYFEKGNQYLNNIEVYKALGNYKLALEYFKYKSEEDIFKGKTHLALGDIYSYINKIELAKTHLEQAEKILKKVGNKATESDMLAIIAHLKSKNSEFNSSINYYFKSIEILKDLNKDDDIAVLYFNMSMTYYSMKDYANFIKYNEIAIKVEQQQGILNSLSQRELAKFYHEKKGTLDKALYYCKEALKIEKKREENLIPLIEIYNRKNAIATKKEEYKLALEYYTIIDSLHNVKIKMTENATLKAFESKYALVEKENEIILINNRKINTRIIYILSIGLLFFISLFFYNKNKNAKIKLSRDKIQLEQRVLRSQMNPHFIFNTLSAIQNSLMDENPLKSITYLSRFSKLIRQNFDFISKSSIYLYEEIDALKNYLDTQKLRFNNEFDYEFDVSQNIDTHDVQIPPLLIQPFIENAIEHGFRHLKKQGLITIRISKKNEYIYYEIKDNGVGFTEIASDNKMHAIDVFKKRIKLRNNKDEESFEMSSKEKGTIIKFRLKQ